MSHTGTFLLGGVKIIITGAQPDAMNNPFLYWHDGAAEITGIDAAVRIVLMHPLVIHREGSVCPGLVCNRDAYQGGVKHPPLSCTGIYKSRIEVVTSGANPGQ